MSCKLYSILRFTNLTKQVCTVENVGMYSYRQKLGVICISVNSRFKKDLKLQIHLHKAFFSDDRFLDSLHKSFLNQTTLDLRKEKWTFLNREFTVINLVNFFIEIPNFWA